MTDTPIIDDAIRAGCKALDGTIGIADECNHPSCRCVKKTLIIAALRAALPWEPSAEAVEAMAYARTSPYLPIKSEYTDAARIYRAQPIMTELYDEKGAPR